MLPSVLEVARQHGLQMNAHCSSHREKEVRFKCPFCEADAEKNGKYYLSLNTSKNLFKCWACGEAGGALKFIALLENKSVEEVKRDLWGSKRSPQKPLHPAEKLRPDQLRAMGFVGFNWGKLKQGDQAYYQRTLNLVWQEWLAHVAILKKLAYVVLLTMRESGEIKRYSQKYAVQLGTSAGDLLLELTSVKFARTKPEWAKSAEWFVKEAKKSEKLVSPDQSMAG